MMQHKNTFKLLRYAVFAFLTLVFPLSVQAHELRPTVADAAQAQTAGVTIDLRVNLEAIVAGIGPEHDNTDDADQSDRYQTLRSLSADDLQASFANMQADFLQKISLENADGLALDVAIDNIDIPPPGDIRLPRDTFMRLIVPHDTASSGMSWQWEKQLGPLIIRTALDEGVSATSSDAEGFSQYLSPGQRSKVFSVHTDNQQSASSHFLNYIKIGIEHIVPKGLDHILFVIGLFLLAPVLKPVILQVSAFTLAHTVTLGLGVSGHINLPASLVEPLIALSITAICVENLVRSEVGSLRLALVFCFGLLHGLGFAGVLGEIGLPATQFFTALLAFNIGVELGQLLVLLMCFAIVGWWFGSKSWYRQVVTIPASSVLGAIGLFWFLQRTGILA